MRSGPGAIALFAPWERAAAAGPTCGGSSAPSAPHPPSGTPQPHRCAGSRNTPSQQGTAPRRPPTHPGFYPRPTAAPGRRQPPPRQAGRRGREAADAPLWAQAMPLEQGQPQTRGKERGAACRKNGSYAQVVGPRRGNKVVVVAVGGGGGVSHSERCCRQNKSIC